MAQYDYIDGPVDRWRNHRAETPRPSMAPVLIGGLLAVAAGVFAIDALRGGSSGGSSTPPAGAAAAVEPIDSVAPEAAPAVATTQPEPAVDVDGCMLDVTSVGLGDSGPAVECVQKALIVAGFYSGAVDGQFNDVVATAASSFQTATGLYVDGIVGRRTATMLGIWPGDDSFVIRTDPPAPGAVDSLGFELSSVASTGSDAPPPPADTGEGTGKRIIYDRAGQRVWAIDDNEQIVRSYLVSGSQYNNEVPGVHEVYSKSETTTAWNGAADLPLMVRWLDTERGAIGFHQIPRHRDDGSLYQTDAELGTRLSGGCQRQTALDAQFMWYFADIGTPVYVS
jgi:peptidoglycan hydrolase-like protein with peptidoglycan-binding domain